MDFNDLLNLMVEQQASDLFITADVQPSIKINGLIHPIGNNKLSAQLVTQLVHSVMNEQQRLEFSTQRECNFAISNRETTARYRVSAFQQRDVPGMVLRRIATTIPQIDDMQLPPILKNLSMSKRGIILVVGATGSGKSTTMAAMIGHRNQNSQGHIITIEDPIEFIHQHAGCIITQREVGIDTESFEIALKNTLRQAPDVILIGEIRSRETMDYAVSFAETGHLVLATLHANNANQAIERFVNFFETERHSHIYAALSLNLKAIIAQQLIPSIEPTRRSAAIEIMINSPLITEHIRKGEVHLIKEIIHQSRELGMQSFDQALLDLYQNAQISQAQALQHADSANDLRLQIKMSDLKI
ncbi:twitching motility protein PilU [Acinetobacter calcoaceticus]|uniref:Twitching motility protein PilU n=1 Tax=Acinetobacter calcoaceticus TaxID=471 RepID=A0A4R1XWL7_ACICA|nr:twitching motility protein PilU [Acinetobacter calcoaceticus]